MDFREHPANRPPFRPFEQRPTGGPTILNKSFPPPQNPGVGSRRFFPLLYALKYPPWSVPHQRKRHSKILPFLQQQFRKTGIKPRNRPQSSFGQKRISHRTA